jgi:hypothetical protein
MRVLEASDAVLRTAPGQGRRLRSGSRKVFRRPTRGGTKSTKGALVHIDTQLVPFVSRARPAGVAMLSRRRLVAVVSLEVRGE